MTIQKSNRKMAILAVFGLIGLFGLLPSVFALQQPEDSALGRRMSISASMRPKFADDLEIILQELQNEAVEKKKKAFLILELHGGTGTFGQIVDAKTLLLSPRFDRVRTVAWIPEDEKVIGNLAILALACNDIIMHPDSDIGDIGEGNPTAADVKLFVTGFVKQGHNHRLHKALVEGMLDPRVHVQRVNIRKAGSKTLESKAVTDAEYRKLLDSGVTTEGDPVDIKMAGTPGIYNGRTMNELDLLIVRTAKNLDEVAAIYLIPPRELLKQKASDQTEKRVAYIKVEREIDFVFKAFLEGQIIRAVKNKKNLIILEITSPGGLLFASEDLARQLADLNPEKVKTVAYIPDQAYSGATIIALGCDEIYMKPSAQIGDAAPIIIGEGQQFERAPEKILSVLKTTMRELARLKNRSPALLQAMVDKDYVVYRVTHRDNPRRVDYMTADEIAEAQGLWIKGPMVPESKAGDLLTVNGVRAYELGLAKRPVANFEELKAQLDIPADMELTPMEIVWVDSLIFWLNNGYVKGFILVLGIACIYLELHFMSGFLGILAVVCFSLFFWSQFMGGTAGWLEVVLFLLGIGCVALEIFVIPGFGVFGVSGGLLLLSSLVLASTTLGSLDPNYSYMKDLTKSSSTVAAAIVVVVVFAMTVNRFLPSIPILNKFLLSPPGSPHLDAEYEPQLDPGVLDDTQMLVGRQGKAVSVLRPAGKIDIDGKYFQVVSDGPYISAGDQVEVVEVTGNRIVVRRV